MQEKNIRKRLVKVILYPVVGVLIFLVLALFLDPSMINMFEVSVMFVVWLILGLLCVFVVPKVPDRSDQRQQKTE